MTPTFTEDARTCIANALTNTQQRGSQHINPTDLLLGIANTPGPGQHALHHHHITTSTLQSVLSTPLPESTPHHPNPSHTPTMDTTSTRTLERAAHLGLKRGLTTISSGLILDALLDEPPVQRVIRALNTTPEELRATLTSTRPDTSTATTADTTGDTASGIAGGVLDFLLDLGTGLDLS